MPMSEAKKRSNKKWNDENLKKLYDRVSVLLPKGKRKAVQEAAKKNGETVNGLINRLIRTDLGQSEEDWSK